MPDVENIIMRTAQALINSEDPAVRDFFAAVDLLAYAIEHSDLELAGLSGSPESDAIFTMTERLKTLKCGNIKIEDSKYYPAKFVNLPIIAEAGGFEEMWKSYKEGVPLEHIIGE